MMSYVRWSSDDFRSDVYCYADVNGGFTTHTAALRVPENTPRVGGFPVNQDEEAWSEWARKHGEQMEFLDACERTPIEHPLAGKTFNDATLEDMRARLVMLKSEGFVVPDSAFEAIDAELEEGET
jgi:hypothetical protein